MKKKVLTMLLAVTMSATVGSPVCAADFTSGAESVTEFSESLVDGEAVSENTADTGTASEEADAEEETKETEEPVAEQEETDDAAVSGELEASEEADAEAFAAEEVAEEEITDEEDSIPEFNDGQEDILTDSAETPSASAKYPSMKKTGDVYVATVKNATEKDYVKFVPNKTGKYVLKMAITYAGGTFTNGVQNVYNSKFKTLEAIDIRGYSAYKLERGKTYYFGMGMGPSVSKVVFQAEMLADVASIKLVKIDKSVVFYTPIDFYQEQYGTANKSQYNVAERWRGKGKIKITYSDGKTETICTDQRNKYGQWLSRYIIYSGKKSSPEPGTYDVHLKFDNSKAEAVVKNVKVKKLSSLATINGSGSKTVSVTNAGMYVRFKTGKNKRYRVSVSFPKYNLGSQGISIQQEKNGELEYANHVQNGGTCTLKANTVYYFYVDLHSGWSGNRTGTIKVTPIN